MSLIAIVFSWIILALPLFVVVRRVGMSPWWNAFSVVPFWGSLVLLWVVAFRGWPAMQTDLAERFD